MLYNKFKHLNVYFWVVDIPGEKLRICILCTDPPPPPPSGKIGEEPLLRFFLRGGGLCAQDKDFKNSLLVTFLTGIHSILWFYIWPEKNAVLLIRRVKKPKHSSRHIRGSYALRGYILLLKTYTTIWNHELHRWTFSVLWVKQNVSSSRTKSMKVKLCKMNKNLTHSSTMT